MSFGIEADLLSRCRRSPEDIARLGGGDESIGIFLQQKVLAHERSCGTVDGAYEPLVIAIALLERLPRIFGRLSFGRGSSERNERSGETAQILRAVPCRTNVPTGRGSERHANLHRPDARDVESVGIWLWHEDRVRV